LVLAALRGHVSSQPVCAQVHVCGSDGQLYNSPCDAKLAGVSSYSLDLHKCDITRPPVAVNPKPKLQTRDLVNQKKSSGSSPSSSGTHYSMNLPIIVDEN
jgi:hypothetical protein